MKLIEAEKAKDVIHEYFKSLMVNGASGTDVDRLAVGIGSCLKHDANLLKAIDELPSAQPDTTTNDSNVVKKGKNDGDGTSGDCISRRQAIDALEKHLKWTTIPDYYPGIFEVVRGWLNGLPSAQPERKTGRWILDRSGAYCCDKCMEPCATYAMMKPRDKFCKMCGADMRGDGRETGTRRTSLP